MAKEEDVVSNLLHQVAGILKQVEESKNKEFDKEQAPEVLKQLEELKGFFDQFNEENRKVFEESGSSTVKLQQTVLSPDAVETRWKRLFEFSKNLRKDLDAARVQNLASSEVIKGDKPFDETKQSKDAVRKRQKKFKQMGGGQDWVRL